MRLTLSLIGLVVLTSLTSQARHEYGDGKVCSRPTEITPAMENWQPGYTKAEYSFDHKTDCLLEYYGKRLQDKPFDTDTINRVCDAAKTQDWLGTSVIFERKIENDEIRELCATTAGAKTVARVMLRTCPLGVFDGKVRKALGKDIECMSFSCGNPREDYELTKLAEKNEIVSINGLVGKYEMCAVYFRKK